MNDHCSHWKANILFDTFHRGTTHAVVHVGVAAHDPVAATHVLFGQRRGSAGGHLSVGAQS